MAELIRQVCISEQMLYRYSGIGVWQYSRTALRLRIREVAQARVPLRIPQDPGAVEPGGGGAWARSWCIAYIGKKAWCGISHGDSVE